LISSESRFTKRRIKTYLYSDNNGVQLPHLAELIREVKRRIEERKDKRNKEDGE